MLRASIALRQQDLTRALALLDRALALEPGHANARYGRATVRRALGDPSGALADLVHIQESAATRTDLRPEIEALRRELAEPR